MSGGELVLDPQRRRCLDDSVDVNLGSPRSRHKDAIVILEPLQRSPTAMTTDGVDIATDSGA